MLPIAVLLQVTNAANSLQKKGIVTFAIGIGDMNSEKRVAELREITNYEANNDKLFMVNILRIFYSNIELQLRSLFYFRLKTFDQSVKYKAVWLNLYVNKQYMVNICSFIIPQSKSRYCFTSCYIRQRLTRR